MKLLKRMAGMLLAICLIVPCFSSVVLAADGIIFFTDLETKVGDEVTITGTVVARGDVLGDASVEMSYDTNYLRFVEGEGVTAGSEGKLTFKGNGDGSSDRVEFDITFQALKEGSTRMEQGSAAVTNASGTTVECETGYADITIGAGDPSKIQPVGKTKEVTVDGMVYTLSEAFTDAELPQGFTAGEITFEGESFKGAVQTTSGLAAAYLLDSQDAGEFWLYNAEDASFYPFEEIVISDTYSIVLLDGSEEVDMPESYTPVSIEINGREFPAWTEPNRNGFYIMYGVNNNGEKSLYLYDSQEHTYQRMETPKKVAAVQNNSDGSPSMLDKVMKVVSDYLIWVLAGVGCVLVILLILLIVVAVKLRHRNLELDDLYDEYGIDEEDDMPAVQPKKKGQFKKQSYEKAQDSDDYYDEDDYYEDEDDYYDEDDDYYEEESYEDDRKALRGNSGVKPSNKRKFEEYYDDDDFDDDDFYNEAPKRRTYGDETFEMDFIDLD